MWKLINTNMCKYEKPCRLIIFNHIPLSKLDQTIEWILIPSQLLLLLWSSVRLFLEYLCLLLVVVIRCKNTHKFIETFWSIVKVDKFASFHANSLVLLIYCNFEISWSLSVCFSLRLTTKKKCIILEYSSYISKYSNLCFEIHLNFCYCWKFFRCKLSRFSLLACKQPVDHADVNTVSMWIVMF